MTLTLKHYIIKIKYELLQNCLVYFILICIFKDIFSKDYEDLIFIHGLIPSHLKYLYYSIQWYPFLSYHWPYSYHLSFTKISFAYELSNKISPKLCIVWCFTKLLQSKRHLILKQTFCKINIFTLFLKTLSVRLSLG